MNEIKMKCTSTRLLPSKKIMAMLENTKDDYANQKVEVIGCVDDFQAGAEYTLTFERVED